MYLYLIDFISLEGLDAPCVTRGYLEGPDLEALEDEARRWAEVKVRLMGDRLWKGIRFSRWVKRDEVPEGLDLSGFEDIHATLTERDQQAKASVEYFESQMEGFKLEGE